MCTVDWLQAGHVITTWKFTRNCDSITSKCNVILNNEHTFMQIVVHGNAHCFLLLLLLLHGYYYCIHSSFLMKEMRLLRDWVCLLFNIWRLVKSLLCLANKKYIRRCFPFRFRKRIKNERGVELSGNDAVF